MTTAWNELQHRAGFTLSPAMKTIFEEIKNGRCPASVGVEILRPHVWAIADAAKTGAIELEEINPALSWDIAEAGAIVRRFMAGESTEFLDCCGYLHF